MTFMQYKLDICGVVRVSLHHETRLDQRYIYRPPVVIHRITLTLLGDSRALPVVGTGWLAITIMKMTT